MMQTETGANAAGSPAAGAADSETPSTADIDPGQAAFEPETSSRAATEEPARPEAEAVTDKAPDKAEAQSETDKAPEKAAETDKAEAQSETDKAPDKAAETNKAEAQSETDKAPEPGKTEAQSETDTAEVKPEGPTFAGLGLPEAILTAVEAAGYTTPTPIQCGTIPALLDGRDVLGQAQTGTGKTAAFALPLLARLNTSLKAPQVLVLAPTRELALQVAEAFRGYAATERSVKVVSLVGGRDDGPQVRDLKRGAAVVIGTPGRVMDHMRRGNLKLDKLSALVLDEADEMLDMGFLEDVEWVLEHTPEGRQVALFSATMPDAIRSLSARFLPDRKEVLLKVRPMAAETIRRRVWIGHRGDKLEALLRTLEGEEFEAVVIFVRTKIGAVDLAEALKKRGLTAAALNGDLPQDQRERLVERLRGGRIRILVATDVAARGLDVERVSHVVNYDPPRNTEVWVHRVGRCGRAGRDGEAILLLTPSQRKVLRILEKETRQKFQPLEIPSAERINAMRVRRFKERIDLERQRRDLSAFRELVESYVKEREVDAVEVAIALAAMATGEEPLFVDDLAPVRSRREEREDKKERGPARPVSAGMERFEMQVGHRHGLKPAQIVGAIANEAGLDGSHIGRILIGTETSTVDLPEGMPKVIFELLKKVRVSGRPLQIRKVADDAEPEGAGGARRRIRGQDRDRRGSGKRFRKDGKSRKGGKSFKDRPFKDRDSKGKSDFKSRGSKGPGKGKTGGKPGGHDDRPHKAPKNAKSKSAKRRDRTG